MFRSLLIATATVALFGACSNTDDIGRPKKKPAPIPGDDISEQSWNKPTRQQDFSTPFGLPTSN
jgi:hypothetical protein